MSQQNEMIIKPEEKKLEWVVEGDKQVAKTKKPNVVFTIEFFRYSPVNIHDSCWNVNLCINRISLEEVNGLPDIKDAREVADEIARELELL